MVRLIQIDRLAPRIEGMLYKVGFDETWSLLDDVGFSFFSDCSFQGLTINIRVLKSCLKQARHSLMPRTLKSC